jgi:hypothetical protein
MSNVSPPAPSHRITRYGFGLAIHLEEHLRSAQILLADVEDLIAAGDTEVGLRFVDLFETVRARGCSRVLRLEMGVGGKYEVEVSRGICLGQKVLCAIAIRSRTGSTDRLQSLPIRSVRSVDVGRRDRRKPLADYPQYSGQLEIDGTKRL